MLFRDEKLGLLAPLFLLVFAAFNFTVPASFWMQVHRLDVLDTKAGEPILIEYDRTIRRAFTADWRVKIRRATGDGLEWVCATPSAREDYDSQSRLPEPVTLQWFAWTDERCYNLTPGQYSITASWEINPSGIAALFFRRTVSQTDTFIIEAAP